MKRLLLALLASFALGTPAMAQEGIPVYFDYLADNYYLVYPSMAGISDGGKVRLTAILGLVKIVVWAEFFLTIPMATTPKQVSKAPMPIT